MDIFDDLDTQFPPEEVDEVLELVRNRRQKRANIPRSRRVETQQTDESGGTGTRKEDGSATYWPYGPNWRVLEDLAVLRTTKEGRQNDKKIDDFCFKLFGYHPHQWQRDATNAILMGYDVMVNAATGDGKSTTFQCLPVKKGGFVLVISPLILLMQQQCTKLNDVGISACMITADGESSNPNLWREIDAGKYRVLFASPEKLLQPGTNSNFSARISKISDHKTFSRLTCICVDECHMVYR